MSSGEVAIQVLIAVALVIILLVVGVFVYNADRIRAIRESGKQKKSVPIFVGIKDMKSTSEESYTTLDGSNPLDPNFRNLSNSINQPGGAEFTYNFWMLADTNKLNQNGVMQVGPDAGLTSDQYVLFVRGSKQVMSYNNLCSKPKNDILVKCPLVKLENGGKILTVEFNTVQGADAIKEGARITCDDQSTDWSYMNSFKLSVNGLDKNTLSGKWNMVTVVIQDTYPSDPLPMRNKVRCRVYINGGVELDKYVDGRFDDPSKSILRENEGNLFIAPQLKIQGSNGSYTNATAAFNTLHEKALMLADMTYFNYALSATDIGGLFKADFTKAFAPAYGSTGATALDKTWMKNLSSDTSPHKMSALM